MTVVLSVLVLAVAACGDSPTTASEAVASLEETTTTTSITTPLQAVVATDEAILDYVELDYVECLREEGLDIEDPELDGEGGLGLRRQFVDDPGEPLPRQVEAAFDACDVLRDDFEQRFEAVDTSDTEDRLLAFAQCMRDEGITEFPDPDLSVWEPGAGLGPGNGPFGTTIFGLQASNEGAAALSSCQALFGGPGTGGPGTGE
jgi:hypothetical protein